MENFRLFLTNILEKVWSQLNLWFDLENSTVYLVLKPFLKNIAADPWVFIVTLLALFGIPYILLRSRKSSVKEGKKLDKLLEKLEQDPENVELEDLDEKLLFSKTDFSKTAMEAPGKTGDPELEFLKDLSLDAMYRKNYSLEGEPDENEQPVEDQAAAPAPAESSLPEIEDEPGEEEVESLPASAPDKILVESLSPEPVSSELAEELEPMAEMDALEEDELESRELEEEPEIEKTEEFDREKSIEDLKWEMERTIEKISNQLSDLSLDNADLSGKIMGSEIADVPESAGIESEVFLEPSAVDSDVTDSIEPAAEESGETYTAEPEETYAEEPAASDSEDFLEPSAIDSDITDSIEPASEESEETDTAEPEETYAEEPAASESEAAEILESSPTAMEDSDSHDANVEEPEPQPLTGSQRTQLLIDRLQKFQEHLQRRLNSLDTHPEKTGLNADEQVDDLVNRVIEPTGVSLPDIKKRGDKENDDKLLESFIFTKTQGKRD